MTCSPSRIRLQGVGIQHRCIIVGSVVQIVDSDGAANAVMENSLPGATVGVTASAQGLPTPVTYSLDDDAGGRFQINSSTGVVTTTGPLVM